MDVSEISNQEVLHIALKIEQEGQAFYSKLAKLVADAKTKEFLQFMAKEEAVHEAQFKELLKEKGAESYGWEKQKEVREFVDTFYETDIFPSLDEIDQNLSNFQKIERALDFAIEAESVSKEFYALLGQFCENINAKTALVLLEKAEQEHLETIESIKDQFLENSS